MICFLFNFRDAPLPLYSHKMIDIEVERPEVQKNILQVEHTPLSNAWGKINEHKIKNDSTNHWFNHTYIESKNITVPFNDSSFRYRSNDVGELLF